MGEEKSLMNMIKTAFFPVMIYYFVHQISAMLLLSFVSGIPVLFCNCLGVELFYHE